MGNEGAGVGREEKLSAVGLQEMDGWDQNSAGGWREVDRFGRLGFR